MSRGQITGSCLCGGVGYQLEGDGVLVLSHCHCSMCRKASGAAFASFLMVPVADFAWTEGEQLIHKYESSKDIFRCHCRGCGSPLPLQDPYLALMAVPVGSVSAYIGDLPQVETFTDDALPVFANSQGKGLERLLSAGLPEVSAEAREGEQGREIGHNTGGEIEQHLAFLSFRQRESAAYWQKFLDKVNVRRTQLGLSVFPADFLEQIAQRGDVG